MTRALSLKLLAVVALALSGLSACEKSVEAPDDTGVCWQMVEEGKGKVHFNIVAKNVPNTGPGAIRSSPSGIRSKAQDSSASRVKSVSQPSSYRPSRTRSESAIKLIACVEVLISSV